MFFERKVDKRSRQEMQTFLSGHFHYNTMNSWNRSTSYANCIKIHRIGLSREQENDAFDFLETDYWSFLKGPIEVFTEACNSQYTMGVNGRSGGYLVLYESMLESTGYKSYCPKCGQRNFKRIPEVFETHTAEGVISEVLLVKPGFRAEVYLKEGDIAKLPMCDRENLRLIERMRSLCKDMSSTDRCGVCGSARTNYIKQPMILSVYSGRSIDDCSDFEEWSIDELRSRVKLVTEFDRACDAIRLRFIEMLDSCRVSKEVVMVPKTVQSIECRA